jgi:hypothetical protein
VPTSIASPSTNAATSLRALFAKIVTHLLNYVWVVNAVRYKYGSIIGFLEPSFLYSDCSLEAQWCTFREVLYLSKARTADLGTINMVLDFRWRPIVFGIPLIPYYWTVPLILDHSYFFGNLTNSKIAETKALEPLKIWHFCIRNFRTSWFPNKIWVVQD